MEIKETTTQLEFNIFKVLKVIENDSLIDEIFRDDIITSSYPMLYTMAKENTLPEEILDRAHEVFERIICLNQKPRKEYLKLFDSLNDAISNTNTGVEYTSEEIKELKEEVKKAKKPKHYGKVRILKDVEANNNVMTELDRAMLALNTLRNINARLRSRGIKEKTLGIKTLSDSDCRDIIAAVRIVENKLNPIFKK